MDLNNQMILMRKEMKRAKTWTIAKLVRHMKNLRSKRGNESQRMKNVNRAERLIQEIDVLKDLKPDTIFKTLLQTNLTVSDLMNSNMTCEQRAVVRIGSVNFIKNKMDEIRSNVESFHLEHSNKKTPSAIKVAENLSEHTSVNVASTSQNKKLKAHPEKMKLSDNVTKATKNDENNAKNSKSSLENTTEDMITERDNNESTRNIQLSDDGSDVSSHYSDASNGDDSGYDAIEKVPNVCTDHSEDVSVFDKAFEDGEPEEDVVIGTTEEGYQVVLPPYYSKQIKNKETTEKEDETSNFNTVAESKGAEDVTEFLPNIGEGFSSPDEKTDDDDIEYEDLVKSGLKAKLKKNGEADTDEKMDLFFIDINGNQGFHRMNKNIKSKGASDNESETQIKSSFLGSLSKSESSHFKEKKNRPSQRARKKAHFMSTMGKSTDNKPRSIRNKQARTNAVKRNPENHKNTPKFSKKIETVEVSIHPSWEASRKRKLEQSSFKPFEGKRICFGDSD